MKKLIKVLKKPSSIILYILNFKIFNIVPDKLYLKIKYRLTMKKKLNLENPTTFNEKLQWLKLHDRKSHYTALVDKILVRNYIKEKIGEEYLIPLIGVYDFYDDINFEDLPNQFVLKPNHTSGNVYICKNKEEINHENLKKITNKWLKRRYYWYHREWPYKNIKPKLLIEQYLVDESKEDIKDYKIMCSSGKPFCLFIAANRNQKSGLTVDFYDLNFVHLPFERHYKNSVTNLYKPHNFDLMISLAKILSIGFTFIRVDFYEVNNKVYFGELTFYPGSGFEEFTPEKYDFELGKYLEL